MHRIADISMPAARLEKRSSITCTCGEQMHAPTLSRWLYEDPHRPIAEAWLQHRRDVDQPVFKDSTTLGDPFQWKGERVVRQRTVA